MLASTTITNNNTNTNNTAIAVNELTNTNNYVPHSSSMVTNNSTNNNDSTIVGLHYKIGKKIGEGSFGVLFEGANMINGVPVAIKFEPRKTEAPQLKDEYRTYKIMTGTPNIPLAYYFGQEGLHNILVIDLLGPSLEDLFDWCGRRFSIKTAVQISVQMITLLEDLHAHDLIYRDIKPDNFLIGRPGQPDENNIHLIDFGMAKQYRDPKTKQHIPYREKKSLSGTARYMSINTHLGREQSRRDDMEALGHVFFYFLRGQLPWQGLKAPNNKQKYEKIGEKKRTTNVYDLAHGLPVQFGRYLEIVRNLGFDETPDYEGYRKLLLSALDDINETADGQYDWMKLNGGRGWDLNINKKPNLHGYGHPNPPDKNKKHRNVQHKYHTEQLPQQPTYSHQQDRLPAQNGQYNIQDPNCTARNTINANRLDRNSYMNFQQQTQHRHSQQQIKQQQHQHHYQQKMMMQDYNGNLNNGNTYNTTEQPVAHYANLTKPTNTISQSQNMGQNQSPHQHQSEQQQNLKTTQQNTDDASSEEHGFFSKLACC